MMEAFPANVPLWDMNNTDFANIPEDDFLALLQKEFPAHHGQQGTYASVLDAAHDDPDGINPQSLSALPIPGGHSTPPLTDDSSPSPSSTTNEVGTTSRRHSASYPGDADGLKRKASVEDLEEGGARKNPHGETPKRGLAALPRGRKSTGAPGQRQDEVRLARRKEQNRAAQRAFRERKEKHVKDLEDRVSELEDANRASQSENENLRDLLTRLQEENQMLKQAAFTFQVPRGGGVPTNDSTQPTAGPSNPQQQPAQQQNASSSGDIDWSSLTTFDPSALNVLDENGDTSMEFSSQTGAASTSRSPYKTIASNPMFMSFAEPYSAWDTTLTGLNSTPSAPPSAPGSQAPSHQNSLDFASFGSWSGNGAVWSPPTGANGSLEDLFTGMPQQSPMDLGGIVPSPSQLSPVSHVGARGSGASTATSASSASGGTPPNPFAFTPSRASPGAASILSSVSSSELSSPPSAGGSPAEGAGAGQCPRTKADFAAHIASQIKSPFVQEQPRSGATSPREASAPAAAIKKSKDGEQGQQILCQGSVFPKTEKSEKNIEVLAAWRSITSNPKFKDVDINELCAEFTNKAKCDGTKVVLDPTGVNQIIDKFTRTH